MMINTICPVCQSHNIKHFLFRENFPVNDNLLLNKQEQAIKINKGNLNIVYCEDCGLVFNQEFDLNKLDYGSIYKYNIDKHFSSTFKEYLETIIHYLVYEKGVQKSNIIEVGCGTGSFLQALIEPEQWGNKGYGFDTTYTGEIYRLEGRLQFEKRYYDSSCTDIPADFVIFRHVIEHIPDPVYFLEEIRKALVNSPHVRIFCETPCVEWSLQNQVFWDFFYEHCNYFSKASLKTAFETSGFYVDQVKHIYQGQYLWIEASIPTEKPTISKQPGSIGHLAQDFSQAEMNFKQSWKNQLEALVTRGDKVALWGAGGKGTTFLNLIDPQSQLISYVVDMNPEKQGTFVAGTGHPIISYHQLKGLGITCVIVVNGNFFDEIQGIINDNNLEVKLINTMV